MAQDDKDFRAEIAAGHRRLFDLLKTGELQANRLPDPAERPVALPSTAPAPAPAAPVETRREANPAHDFLREAVASLAPDRDPDWRR